MIQVFSDMRLFLLFVGIPPSKALRWSTVFCGPHKRHVAAAGRLPVISKEG